MPAISDLLEGYKARTLNTLERRAFGEAALILKYDELEKAPVGARKDSGAPSQRGRGTHALERAQRGAGKYDGRRPARLQPPPSRQPPLFSANPAPSKDWTKASSSTRRSWHLAETLRASEPLTPDHLRDHAEVSTAL